jgi:hypothetical protein
MPSGGVFIVILLVILLRPVMEIYYSRQCICPHCEADLFLEICQIEMAEGIEQGLICRQCGHDASKISSTNGPVIDIGS